VEACHKHFCMETPRPEEQEREKDAGGRRHRGGPGLETYYVLGPGE